MNRKGRYTIIGLVFAVIVIIITISLAIIKKYKPSKEVMDLNDYYLVNEDEALIVFQDGIYEKKAIFEDGAIYLDYDTAVNLLNKRFYWDTKENLLILTTPTKYIRTDIGSKSFSINKNNDELKHPVTKTKDGTLYIAIDFIDKYSDMEYQFFENPNRVTIKKDWGQYLFSTVEKDTQLRVKDSIKSEILLELTAGTELIYIENDTVYKNGFCKVINDEGVIGYVRSKDVSESQYKEVKSSFVEEEYIQTKKDEPIKLVWHQVTNQKANNNLLNDLEGTKGVTTISPTWYSVTSNEGTISSLADETYVSRAHSLGIEVWALIDDFNTEVNMEEVLSRTSRREKLINELISSAIKYDLDGINIDFEHIPQDAGIHYVQFLRELSIRCRSNGLVLSTDNYVPSEYRSYYDIEEQGVLVDYVVIMAYDEHYRGSSESGPVASIKFVEDAIEKTIAMVPKEKILIGIPFYNRMWKEDDSGIVEVIDLAMTNAEDMFRVNGVEAEWDKQTGLSYGEYEKDGFIYKMWLEDESSIDLKLQTIKESGVAGIGAWKLDLEKEEIWNVINKYLN